MSGVIVATVAVAVVAAAVVAVLGRSPRRALATGRVRRGARIVASAADAVARATAGRVRRLATRPSRRATVRRTQQALAAERALATMGDMKGVAMKLGQIVSFMDDVVPDAVTEKLRPLQRSAAPMEFATVRAVIEDELDAPLERLVAELSTEPIAAASIGQVHRGVRHDGRAIAVKVQYPGVADAMRADLANVGLLMRTLGAFMPSFDARPLAEELRARMLEELDYVTEARNQQRFHALFAGDRDIAIPAVHADMSTARVITTELCAGGDFYEFCEHAPERAKQRAGLALHRFVFESIWHHRLFNADPHPGNFLFEPSGRVVCLDFGSVKQFSPEFVADMLEMTRCYLDGERGGFYEQARRMKFILPGQEHRVAPEWLWDYVRWYHEPILRDEPFTYSRDYTRKSAAVMFGDNMRKVNMPPDYLMLTRITFGVNSLLARLGARHNWHRLARDSYLPAAGADGAASDAA